MLLMAELKDQIYAWFLKQTKSRSSAKIRSAGVMGKLYRAIRDDPIAIRQGLMALKRDGLLDFLADPRGEPLSGYISVSTPEEIPPDHQLAWQDVLANAALSEADTESLSPLWMKLESFSTADMRRLLTGLLKLRAEQHQVFGQPNFVVSAAYLLGSSKLLGSLDARSLKSFGIELDRFPSRPPYVVVGGNGANPEAVILVENPWAFETAVQTFAGRRCTFICTFGFGLSQSGSDYGQQLAGAVETGAAILLRRTEGPVQSLQALLSHPEVHFWGDLDYAAMQIFERITKGIPTAKLSALYRPMIEARRAGDGHPYTNATGKSCQKPYIPLRQDVQALLDYCRDQTIDQEVVTPAEIERLAGLVLQPNNT